ncbi:MAG: FAD-dependent oxidoreductase [Actinomycetia bacterium]|nr:FAD-dependent oxidoreductase [Actinomycetes bacterium]
MSKAVIFALDDEPTVLAAVQRDLRSEFAERYRILSATSGGDALATLVELKARGTDVAVFVVDQRMPEMSGTQFLVQAMDLFPGAKRVLLTAYADTDAAIAAINEVGLDHYLLKPWDPPTEKLYPVIEDVLVDWEANRSIPFEGVRVLGTTWSPATYEIKTFLARNAVPYRFEDIERDTEAAAIVDSAASSTLPLVLLPDGTTLSAPDRMELAEATGFHTAADSRFYDLVIIGGGPAGLAGAVYGASEGLTTAMIEREAPGGQAGTSSRIENYLGFPKGIAGADLAHRAIAQASRLGAELITAAEVTSVRVEGTVKIVELSDGSDIRCKAILVASGMTVRRLGVPGYEKYEGAGVYYGAAATEAATYKDQPIYVVGGANSAGQAAVMFSKTSSKVTMVVRSTSLGEKMSAYLVEQIASIDNIDVITNTKVVEVSGESMVASITLENRESGDQKTEQARALFIFVGAIPHSGFLKDAVELNDHGFIYTGQDVLDFTSVWPLERDPFPLETSAPGIFAAGDVREGAVRRVASAVGEGSVSVSMIHRYLDTV